MFLIRERPIAPRASLLHYSRIKTLRETDQAFGHSTNLSAKTTAAVDRRNLWADAAAYCC
jgi:hypothetical protein